MYWSAVHILKYRQRTKVITFRVECMEVITVFCVMCEFNRTEKIIVSVCIPSSIHNHGRVVEKNTIKSEIELSSKILETEWSLNIRI